MNIIRTPILGGVFKGPLQFFARPRVLLHVLLASLFGLANLPSQAIQTHAPSLDQTLPNGLRVLVYESRRAPTALHMVWIGVGSIDEQPGKTGLAHVLEHMMFKGTKTLAPGEFSRRVAALGGRENAFTSKEYTGYFQQVHRDALFEVMALEADRMQNLKFSDEDFKKEILVVMEERRLRTDDNPQSLAYEALLARAFTASPVRHPIIGWMADLKALKPDDARRWYETWYAPNNATVIVAGDVDSAEVLKQVQSLYGQWKSKPLNRPAPVLEPEQLGARVAQVSGPGKLPFALKAWKTPSIGSTDGPIEPNNPRARDAVALSMLGSILDHPDFGRLSQKLVREQRQALGVGTQAEGISRSPGIFLAEATPVDGVTPVALVRAIEAEIALIASQGIGREELDLIRLQAKAAEIYKKDSLFSTAMDAGRLIAAGRPINDSRDWLAMLDAIEPADIQRVAKEYFLEKQSTLIEFEPVPLATNRPAPAAMPPSGSGRAH